MGTLRDITDTIGNIEGDLASLVSGGKKFKSLSKASMDGTLNFPVIVSNALSIEDASLVSKALERQFASFTLTLMTMNPYLYTMGGRATAANYINKFHQNVDTRFDSTDVHNAISNLMTEAANRLDIDDYEVLSEVSECIIAKVYENVNHSGVNANHVRYSYTIEDVTESSILNNYANKKGVLEANGGKRTAMPNFNYNNQGGNTKFGDQTFGDVTTGDINIKSNIDGGQMGREIGRALARTSGGGGGSKPQQFNHMSVSSDYKKANELVPTLLHMRIFPIDSTTKTELPPIDFVVGIKATMHPVSSEEMVVNIARGIKNENMFFNFIRWTTGEISFFKDFLLSMNELKIDAINTGNSSSRWWTMLKRRKNSAKIKNTLSTNRLLPNATIVITQEEADMVRDQYGYNLEKPNIAYKLMENYFLISFVIVDPALQRVKFLFDGKNEFESMTYANLARENNVDDRKFKEMVNMLGRRI